MAQDHPSCQNPQMLIISTPLVGHQNVINIIKGKCLLMLILLNCKTLSLLHTKTIPNVIDAQSMGGHARRLNKMEVITCYEGGMSTL